MFLSFYVVCVYRVYAHYCKDPGVCQQIISLFLNIFHTPDLAFLAQHKPIPVSPRPAPEPAWKQLFSCRFYRFDLKRGSFVRELRELRQFADGQPGCRS